MALVGLAAAGCSALTPISPNQCGNGVVEAPEDCDSFAPSAQMACRPRGSPGECRFTCRRGSDTSAQCPADWGCSVEGTCRPQTDRFEVPAHHEVGGIVSLLAADFDGDGRTDVLSRGPIDGVGRSKLRFHYFDGTGALAETLLFPKLLASPAIADLDGDGRTDLAFSNPLVGLMLGRPNRSWIPETFASFPVPDASLRILSILDQGIGPSPPFVMFTAIPPEPPGLYVLDSPTGARIQAPLQGSLAQLVGDPVSGDIIEDAAGSPCAELVYARREQTSFVMLDPCTRSPTGSVTFRARALEVSIPLEPPAPIDAAPRIVDLDGNGHLDVLVGAGGRIYWAMGDGRGVGPAVPYRLAVANPQSFGPRSPEVVMPLAVGDVSGDGAPDFVFPEYLLISRPTFDSPLPTYVPGYYNYAATWNAARIADLNHDGAPDIVAISSGRQDVSFFNGTGSPSLTGFRLPTNGTIVHLAIVDMDGDRIDDLALVEAGSDPTGPQTLSIAFGAPAGPPRDPTEIARVGQVSQLGTYHLGSSGHLTLVASKGEGSNATGVLTLVPSSGDRLPFAPFDLGRYEANSLRDWGAAGMAAGRFRMPSTQEVMALVTPDFTTTWAFWLLAGLATDPGAPVFVPGRLDARLTPTSGTSDFDLQVSVTNAVADLDADGIDESIWAFPADGRTRCGLVIVGMPPRQSAQLQIRDTILLDEPCVRGQLVASDADGDGRIDVALLTGPLDGSPRKIVVAWNDGQGSFAPAPLAAVSGGDEPAAFTVLAAAGMRPPGFAYVTATNVVTVSAIAGTREFGPARPLVPMQRGSGLVSADVDDDGARDLVVAAGGNLVVLKAVLAP